MAHTYQEYDSLLKQKDALIAGQRSLLEAKEELTKYIDSNRGSDGSAASWVYDKREGVQVTAEDALARLEALPAIGGENASAAAQKTLNFA